MNLRYLLVALLCLGLAGTAFAVEGATPGSDQTDAAGNPVTGSSTESGWAGDPDGVTASGARESVTLTFDRPVSAAGGTLRITWLDVNDSRCPEGVACFWEGQVSITIGVAEANGQEGRYEIALHQGDEDQAVVAAGGYTIRLLKVAPYPVHEVTPPRSDYEALLTVSPLNVPGTDDVLPGEPGDPDIDPADRPCGTDAAGVIFDEAGNCVDPETGEVWPGGPGDTTIDPDGTIVDNNGDGWPDDKWRPCADDGTDVAIAGDGQCADPNVDPGGTIVDNNGDGWPDDRPWPCADEAAGLLVTADGQCIDPYVDPDTGEPRPGDPDGNTDPDDIPDNTYIDRNGDGIPDYLCPCDPDDPNGLVVGPNGDCVDPEIVAVWDPAIGAAGAWPDCAIGGQTGSGGPCGYVNSDGVVVTAEDECVDPDIEPGWDPTTGQPWPCDPDDPNGGIVGADGDCIDPNTEPRPDPRPDIANVIVDVFRREMMMLVKWDVLSPPQAEVELGRLAAQMHNRDPQVQPDVAPLTPEKEELVGFAAELAHHIDADGWVPWDEIVSELAHVALKLGLIDQSQVDFVIDPPRPDPEVDRVRRTVGVFHEELAVLARWDVLSAAQVDAQVESLAARLQGQEPPEFPDVVPLNSDQLELIYLAEELAHNIYDDGSVPWGENIEQLAHMALELGLIEEGQVDPIVDPGPEPLPYHAVADMMVEVFHEELWHLVEWDVLREDQVDWQIIAFRMELGIQDAILEPPADAALNEAQEELVAYARELAGRVAEDGQVAWDRIKYQLGMMGVELGLVDASLIEEPQVTPPPDPTVIRNQHIVGMFHEELMMLAEWGALLPHQAEWLIEIYAAQLYGQKPEPVPPDLEIRSEQEELVGVAWELAHLISETGEVPWEEIRNRLAHTAVELGLIDQDQVPPTRPPVRPDPLLERSHMMAGIFERNLSQLTEWNLLIDAQHERALAEFLFEVGLFAEGEELPPEVEIGPELAELLAAARETAGWISEEGEVRWERIHHHLASVAVELGLIDENLVEIPPEEPVDPEPRPGPGPQEQLMAISDRLEELVAAGELSQDEADAELRGAAAELGLLSEDGEIIWRKPPDKADERPRYTPAPEELAMIGLLRELVAQMQSGDITTDDAWEKLTSLAAENGWTEIDAPAGGEEPVAGAPDEQDGAYAAGNELMLLRSNLALQVSNEALSGEEAFNQLSGTLDSLGLAAADGDDGTVIQAASWGAIKSVFSR